MSLSSSAVDGGSSIPDPRARGILGGWTRVDRVHIERRVPSRWIPDVSRRGATGVGGVGRGTGGEGGEVGRVLKVSTCVSSVTTLGTFGTPTPYRPEDSGGHRPWG